MVSVALPPVPLIYVRLMMRDCEVNPQLPEDAEWPPPHLLYRQHEPEQAELPDLDRGVYGDSLGARRMIESLGAILSESSGMLDRPLSFPA